MNSSVLFPEQHSVAGKFLEMHLIFSILLCTSCRYEFQHLKVTVGKNHTRAYEINYITSI